MRPDGTWPRHMTRLDRYGRLQVGQRVEWERLTDPPTTGAPARWLTRGVEPVTVRTEHEIVEIRTTESGAAVVLRHSSGALQVAYGVDGDGIQRGAFGSLRVLTETPYQARLFREWPSRYPRE